MGKNKEFPNGEIEQSQTQYKCTRKYIYRWAQRILVSPQDKTMHQSLTTGFKIFE